MAGARIQAANETLLNVSNPHHRLTKDLYPRYPFPLIAGKDWEKLEPRELTYHGHLILGAYQQETGLGFGRVFPAQDANYIKLLNTGFEVFANWRQPHRQFIGYLYAVTGGPEELMAVGTAIVEGDLRAARAPVPDAPSDVQAGERSRGVTHVEEARPKHFPHRIWAACDFEGRTPDYGWFGPPETNNVPRYPGNTTALGAGDRPYQNVSALMTGINPVPGPRMGKVNQLYLRYFLRGGTEATFQHFSLTSEDNNHVRVGGLTEGQWSEVTVNFTRDGQRNDGTPGIPFQEGERMDDLKIFVGKPGDGKRYDLAIDDVIFFATDPDLPPEPEPFPNRVIFLAAFDTGTTATEKPKYWPGEFEIVSDDLPSGSQWNVARAVPQPDTKGKWIRLPIVPPRPVGARTKLRFRYHLTGTSQMTVQLFDLTDGDNRHIRLRDLEPGAWRTAYPDFTRDARRNDGRNTPFAAGHLVDDLFFFVQPEAGGEVNLLIDEVVLFDAGKL